MAKSLKKFKVKSAPAMYTRVDIVKATEDMLNKSNTIDEVAGTPMSIPLVNVPKSFPKCIDCKYRIHDFVGARYSKCTAAPVPRVSDYSGLEDDKIDFYFCTTSRKYVGMCGPEGRHFDPLPPNQPKLSLWQRLINKVRTRLKI